MPRHVQLEMMLPLLEQRAGALDRRRDDVADFDRVPAKVDLAAGNPRDVEQIVDQPHQVAHLPVDDRPFALGAGIAAQRHQLQRRQDGRERIPQLVAEHRQELVLGAAGRLLGRAQRVQLRRARFTSSVTSNAMTRIPSTSPLTLRRGW